MRRTIRLALVLAAVIFLAAPPRIGACTRVDLSLGTISFGTYRPNDADPRTTSARVDARCRDEGVMEVPYSLSVSAGVSGRFDRRTLTSGGDALEYNLFTDAMLRSILGDGSGRSTPLRGIFGAGRSSTDSHIIYGLIPAGQTVPSGAYVDTLVITLAF